MDYIGTFFVEVGILAYFLNDDPGDMLQGEIDTADRWWADWYNAQGEITLVPEAEHDEMALCSVTRLISRCAKVKMYAHPK